MGSLHLCLCIIFYAFACLLFCISGTYSDGGNEMDQRALLEFKARIAADPFGVMNSWNDTIYFCNWYGVTCGRRHQRVTVLNLTSSGLAGTISPYIGNLSFLRVLHLENNSLVDNIPPEIGRLQRLQTLGLLNNSLTGEIPTNISRCSNLVNLSVRNNKLTGKIPVEFGFLLKLQYISLDINNFTGTIPYSLGNLSSLSKFFAAFNNFVGNIPDTFGQLKDLRTIGLLENKLSGTVPSAIFNLSSLQLFEIGVNNFEGFIPAELFTSLPNLQFLSLAVNRFTGPIPSSISNASSLVGFQFLGNLLTGKVPSFDRLNVLQVLSIDQNHLGDGEVHDLGFMCSLTNSSNLLQVSISQNNFGGSLPDCIGNLSFNFLIFDLSSNQISGIIPSTIGNLVNLNSIGLNDNMFSGMIPQSIGNLQNIVIMKFENNKLSGLIPSSLGNLTKLSELYFASNILGGTIPSSLANCTYLQILDFSGNNLTGAIPPQVMGLSSLSISVNLSGNSLSGSLPKEVGNLKALGTLDLSNNMLSGEIPVTLSSCSSLEYLYMDRNRFKGTIPSSLSSLRTLQVVDLSHNDLSGHIPIFFASFDSLLSLNLSFNNFEGVVPTVGVFKNASITLLKGNNKLCGGIPEFHLPICHFNRSSRRRLKVIIAIVVGISIGIWALLSVFLLLRFKNKRYRASVNSNNSLVNVLRVSYNDLHVATNGFLSDNLIGSGSFGSVYKGILAEGGQTVAVKVLNLQNHGAIKSFMAECEALRNTRHRNLVKVMSACSSVDNQGNDFKALVFEFMNNGSLEEWLHPTIHEGRESDKKLNLIQRFCIAIDIVSAIEYLHVDSGIPIVHCDLKPSNVLLDDEMNAHVSDFGLAKFLLPSIRNNSSNQSSSIGLRGTVGYLPPEYGVGSEISKQGDVYSYGILLLEMFTGKRPTDNMFNEGHNLHNMVESTLPNRIREIVDPVILQDSGQFDDRILMESLVSVLEIGVSCSAESPTNRMDISDAAIKLNSIRDSLMNSRIRNH